jgi:hypothetical protein
MSQKSSVPQAVSFVSQLLKRDMVKKSPSSPRLPREARNATYVKSKVN